MVRMIPAYPREGANASERKVFSALEGIQGHDDWVAIHSLGIGRHASAFQGEADFIILAPGQGILVIEVKSPAYVEYKGGDWYLDRVPSPHKDPLKQLDGARRSIRHHLRERDLLAGSEPIARLIWFTSIGRHQFENKTPGDLQFFEWELGWSDDLSRPAWLIEKTLTEYNRWYSSVDEVANDPAALTVERVELVADVLVSDFVAKQTSEERARERRATEMKLLGSQEVVLELTDTNDHVYFEGPAGTGKSYLITQSARRFNRESRKTLVACWNVLMADELQRFVGGLPNVDVADLNSLMLQLIGIPANPADAPHEWYTRELPERAIAVLRDKPHLGGYEAICIDEFQDVAGNLLLLELIFALAGTGRPAGTKLVFAGDSRQQIMRRVDEHVNPFAIAKSLIPDLVHVRVRRNCRAVPGLTSAVESTLRQQLGYTRHRVAKSVPGGLSTVDIVNGNEAGALVAALRDLLQHHAPEDIVVLSPFAEKRSLAGRLLARPEKSQDERWLRKQLQEEGLPGKIRWRSVFKFKGLDADAVVLTDLGPEAKDFVAAQKLEWSDLLYVALTRAKYRCVLLKPEQVSS
ncbi:MAG: NERD domain-containing protein [Microbacterium sp.]|uniref:nuclease-related domain-containing DEAD/DEAH box helicase n=1 Tax=Microbacterium sp. TaxID=51671 RepID=UPI0019BB231C|nr:NERD domain-containing protein [Microbacterium sp.]MBD3756804.1 NERD domain-containing protein [Microbacterium sp.]